MLQRYGDPKMRAVALLAVSLLAASCGQPPGYITSAELGDKWPLTVDEGVLECVNQAVTFKTPDRRVFAVNGTAKGRGHAPIEPIWKAAPLGTGFKTLDRLSEQEKRTVFAESVACEDEAESKATERYPAAGDFKRQIALQEQLSTSCKSTLRKRHKLTEDEHASISVEGVSRSWPPLTPTRVNISPLIERGLKLCES